MRVDQNDFSAYSDQMLCDLVAQGSVRAEEELVSRYSRLVRICARPLFLAGGDSEDLIQEGMVGLLHAMRNYDPERQAQFRTYAEVCIRSRLLSAVRAAGRDKHSPLNHYVSLETPLFDTAVSIQGDNPEDMLIDREVRNERLAALKDQLSSFEAKILRLYLGGLSYGEIAQQIGRSAKSVDNAVQRIRRKLARQLTSGDISES